MLCCAKLPRHPPHRTPAYAALCQAAEPPFVDAFAHRARQLRTAPAAELLGAVLVRLAAHARDKAVGFCGQA